MRGQRSLIAVALGATILSTGLPSADAQHEDRDALHKAASLTASWFARHLR
jgi:hypothetical protein